MIGSRKALAIAIRNNSVTYRNTQLTRRLRDLASSNENILAQVSRLL